MKRDIKRRFVDCLLAFGCLFLTVAVEAQTASTAPVVTGTASAERIRFVAANNVVRIRVEVLSDSGDALFDFSGKGNVFDWTMQDGSGQRVGDGTFVCVVTVKSLSGKLSQRIGTVSVQGGKATLQGKPAQLTTAQQAVIGPVEENAAITILPDGEVPSVTVTAHDGKDGQVTATTGALTFRTGDVFRGTEKERMRITEEGKVGIGTDNPESALDVNGTVKAGEGIQFSDGTRINALDGKVRVTDADGNIVPNAAGTGTQNKIAKWAETGGSGTLTDSAIFEDASSNIGIGTTTPLAKLNVKVAANQNLWARSNGELSLAAVNDAGSAFVPMFLEASKYSFTTGSVGIGTTIPGSQLHVAGAGQTTAAIADAGPMGATLKLIDGAGAAGSGGAILFGGFAGNLYFAGIKGLLTGGAGNTVGDLAFSTRNAAANAALTERMRILANGNVGIGTTNPLAKLNVKVAADQNLWARSNGELSLSAVNDAGSAFVPMYLEASKYSFTTGNVGIGITSPTAALQIAGPGGKALEIASGRVILSYAGVAGGTSEGTASIMPSTAAIIEILSNGVGSSGATASLPVSAEPGMVITVGTSDPDGAVVFGVSGGANYSFNVNQSVKFTRIADTWKFVGN